MESPGAVLPGGDFAVVPGPVAGRRRGDDVAVAVARAPWRRGQIAVDDRKLHHRVEGGERLVVGDVFLRLLGDEQRQAQR